MCGRTGLTVLETRDGERDLLKDVPLLAAAAEGRIVVEERDAGHCRRALDCRDVITKLRVTHTP